ncbi:MAG: HEPN domain-containing protein [Candidatus Caldarchaeales archaeon]
MVELSFREAEIIRERAEAFLENAERLVNEGKYDLAAFSIEQYCQLMLKFKLLLKTGTYPRIHSILGLLRLLSSLSKDVKDFVEDSQNILYLTKIEDTYIGARYLPRRYEESEVKDMLKFVKEVFKAVVERI